MRGLLLFLREGDDPHPPPGAVHPLLTAAHLDRILPDWLAREPDNPFVAVLAPLAIPRDDDLRACAPAVWRTIQEAPLEPPVRATLERMLEFWLFERFPSLTTTEIRTMLHVLVPLEQTRAYQEIFAKGKADGEAEGEAKGEAKGEARGEAKGKAESLKRLLTRRFGPLPRWAAQRLDAAATDQLDTWLEGIFDAQSLDGLIGPKPRRGKREERH